MFRKITFNKISRLDVELARSNGAIVGNFRLGIEDANTSRIRVGIALVGLILTLPSALGLAAGALKQFFGIATFYDSTLAPHCVRCSAGVAAWNLTLMKGSLFVGSPLALIVGVIAATRVGFTRAQDRIKTFLAVQTNPVMLLTIGIALAVVALFYGHLVADA